MALSLTHKIIKGVPVFIDKDNNVYLFTQQTSETSPIKIGTTNGTSLTLIPEWDSRCSDYLKHYRSSLQSFQRTEHTKAVKYVKKPSNKTQCSAASAGAAATDSATATVTKERKTKVKNNSRANPRQPRNKPAAAENTVHNP